MLWFKFLITVLNVIFVFFSPSRVYGMEKLPEGAAILCPNHTTFRDPLYVAMRLGYRHRMAFMAKAELFGNWFTKWFFGSIHAIPVKRGTGDLNAIKKSMEALKDGRKLVMFPEGTRVKEGEEVEAKAGAAMLAAKTNASIVPIYIKNGKTVFKVVRLYIGDPIEVKMTDKKNAAQDYKNAATACMAAVKQMEQQYGSTVK